MGLRSDLSRAAGLQNLKQSVRDNKIQSVLRAVSLKNDSIYFEECCEYAPAFLHVRLQGPFGVIGLFRVRCQDRTRLDVRGPADDNEIGGRLRIVNRTGCRFAISHTRLAISLIYSW
jgi:hypothetical protein